MVYIVRVCSVRVLPAQEFDSRGSDVSLTLCSSANLSRIHGGISAVSGLLEEIISTKQMRIS